MQRSTQRSPYCTQQDMRMLDQGKHFHYILMPIKCNRLIAEGKLMSILGNLGALRTLCGHPKVEEQPKVTLGRP